MRRELTKQTLKLRVLAFVLAVMLVWYSINPAPRLISRIKREDELPDEKKREAKPQLQRAAFLSVSFGTLRPGLSDVASSNQDEEDDFDWPEFILD